MKSTEELDLEWVIRKYSDMVYHIAMMYGKTKEDTEDIFQEVFLRLVKYIERLENEEHIRNWLIRVTINCGKTYLMKTGRAYTLPLNEGIVYRKNNDQSEIEQQVYAAVRSLPERYRTIVHLYYYEELSVKEISECLNRKEGTVKSQLARGRRLIERKLGKEFGNGTVL